ncbi:MAG: uroporphyrinogen-III C-methyltransferase [Candidatus Lambdaproteobacteria bacterium]|nr:uroporphyrinogen-III C-methyltransferase [Candidatus Lambdaproteobacteria bacterium]
MDYLPIFMKLQGRACTVISGGAVARRKVELLLRAGARVSVVAPALEPVLAGWARAGVLEHRPAGFTPACLAAAAVVIAATDDRAVNRQAAQAAQHRGIPVNVVDDPAACTFIVPAIVDRSPIVVAVSSGGRAPVLARLLRARLEQVVSGGYGRLAELAGRFRSRIKARLRDPRARNRFWERVFQGPVAELALAGREREAGAALAVELEHAAGRAGIPGAVWLVGAGPGDAELLTLRAARLLQEADAIVYDRLVSRDILALARRDAERIDVGKSAGHATLTQAEINALLLRLARAGQRVVRLKGGDPFIFGRGGEEQEALAAAGIRCEVVPGITAAAGCAARLGIPLTHREHAHSVVLATGHPSPGGAAALPPVAPGQTLVVYMGMARLPALCTGLLAQGLSPDTPAALIQEGTTERERSAVGTLATLPALAALHAFRAPALLIVGDVVRFGCGREAGSERSAWTAPAGVAAGVPRGAPAEPAHLHVAPGYASLNDRVAPVAGMPPPAVSG